jgi:acyl carrier protein
MGLDLVELVMQTEEVFGITIPDAEAAQASTVGGLYGLVLAKLEIPYQPAKLDAPYRHRNFAPPKPWTAPEVWATLRDLIQSQLQIPEEDIHEEAHFQNDLGAD